MHEREYSPQRATKVAAAASLGTLLTLVGVMTVGADSSSTQASSSASDSTTGLSVVSAAAPVAVVTAATSSVPTTAAATTAAPTTTVACTNTYTVQSGDYWLLLAKETGVGVDALYALNGAGPDTALFAGASVCLPKGATVVTVAPATTAVHTSKPVTTSAAPVVTAAQTTRTSG